MLENPKYMIGGLMPLAVIDVSVYELYRLFPTNYCLVLIPLGLGEFAREDVERVFGPLESLMDQIMERGMDIIMQNGVPLPLLIGVEAHDRMVEKMASYTGKPATTTVGAVTRAARAMGIRKVACVNKWTEAMNRTLGEFFAREGVSICGTATREIAPADFQKIKADDHSQLAYELGRRALDENPDCDALYIGGGSWLVADVGDRLEEEFGKPVITNQAAMVRDVMHKLGDWRPLPGHSRLLATA
jgi:arylmalonate decarboxylase